MKLHSKISLILTAAMLLVFGGCKKILEEHPKSNIVPTFLATPTGLLGALTGVYNDLRSSYGTEGFTLTLYAGTDEMIAGSQAQDNGVWNLYNGLNGLSTNGGFNVWYQDINTLNGILKYAPASGLPAATLNQYVGQAKFLRAFCYFYLLTTYGNVPLHTTFNTQALSADAPAAPAAVYTQIIQDLLDASTELPPTITAPFLGKAATAPTALFLLSKVYLTRGWSSSAQPTDFQSAYNTATTLITNKATYGLDLWQDYGDAFKMANDYGKEVLFVSDHDNNVQFGQFQTGASGGNAQNVLPNLFRWNYVSALGINSSAGVPQVSTGPASMVRDVNNGRPYTRAAPNTPYTIFHAFADQVNDSRYAKTFQTFWICNTPCTSARGTLVVGVDTAILMPGVEVPQARRDAFKGVITTPSQYNNNVFPTVKKFDDLTRSNMNDPSTRPYCIYRFSEVYFIAAEAAFKLNDNVNAANYLNMIRERAAFRTTNTAAQNAAAALAMDITPAQVDIDFILDEYTREFYGEARRWYDLVRTQQLIRRVGVWNPKANANIQAFDVLRPIPQDEINAVLSGPPYPQNPGFH
jgi:starch-binding outer membrane protein, SusD/RagB family